MGNNTTDMIISDAKPLVTEYILLMLFCIIALTSNMFVMALIIANHRLKSSTNMFVFSLCLCNSIISLIVIPMRTFAVHENIHAMLAYKYIVIITILIYICNLTAVSRHRLLCITKPLTYAQSQTKRKVFKTVAANWIVPIAYGLLPLCWFKLQNMSRLEKLVHTAYKLLTLVFLLAPLVFMVYVFIKVYTQAETIRKHQATPSSASLVDPSELNAENVDLARVHKAYLENKARGRLGAEVKEALGIFICRSNDKRCDRNEKLSEDSFESDTKISDECSLRPSPEQENKQLSLSDSTADHLNKNENHFSPMVSNTSKESLHSPNILLSNNCNSIDHNETRGNNINTFLSSSFYIAHRLRHRRAAITANLSFLTRRKSINILQQVIRRKATELKGSLAFFIVAMGYMITWVPVITLTLIDIIDKNLRIPQCVELISLYTISFNALMDPFLYGLLLPSFRTTLKLSIRRRKDKRSISRGQNISK